MAHNTDELISAYKASGLTQKAFCADRGINCSTLQYHLEKRRKNNVESQNKEVPGRQAGCFVPLRPVGEGAATRSFVLIQGAFGIEEIAELIRAVAH
ncbi:MAG: hypothetical protein GF344_09365 [Chitinivibrionales bacterium]|nr:hypothetical protein [Chitinivibrionales bacterium]MBD3357059.1 hypothetical protein [Chitinivibrionales bacterium]